MHIRKLHNSYKGEDKMERDTKILKVARIRKDYTIDELAKELKINRGTYIRYEKGNYKNIKLETVKKLMDLLEINPMELIENMEPLEEE